MTLSIKTKLYLLSIANFLFIALLFWKFSTVFSAKNSKHSVPEYATLSLNSVSKISISNTVNNATISLHRGKYDEFVYNFEGFDLKVNQHAIIELLSVLKNSIPSHETNQMNHNCKWNLTVTDHAKEIKFYVSDNIIFASICGKFYMAKNNALNECLNKIFHKFLSEKLLWTDLSSINFLHISGKNIAFTLSKQANSWVMDVPLRRPMGSDFVAKILHTISQICCERVSKFDGSKIYGQRLFSITCGALKDKQKLVVFSDDENFYVRKGKLIFDFSNDDSNSTYLKNLANIAETVNIFTDTKFDSMDVKRLDSGNFISLQKLEEENNWQMSYDKNGSLIFIDVDRRIIDFAEQTIGTLNSPISFDQKPAQNVFEINLKSNIGNLEFRVFDCPEEYFILNKESNYAFAVRKEFIDILFQLFKNY